MTTDPDARIELGHLTGAWSASGWVKVFSRTSPPENIFEYQPWLCDAEPFGLHVREWHRRGRRLVARIEEITDRDRAEAFRGCRLWVPRAQLPAPGAQSWYWQDLIGLDAITMDGRIMGRVAGMLDAGAHDVLQIEASPADGSESSTREDPILVPFVVGHFVQDVDLDAGRITLDWDPDW